jgi:hypothetical protein
MSQQQFLGFEPQKNKVTRSIDWVGQAEVVGVDDTVHTRDNGKQYRWLKISLQNFAGNSVVTGCSQPVTEKITMPVIGEVITVSYSYRADGKADFHRRYGSDRLSKTAMRQDIADAAFKSRLDELFADEEDLTVKAEPTEATQ